MTGTASEGIADWLEETRPLGSTDGAWRLNEWEIYQLLDRLGIEHGPARFVAADAPEEDRRRWAAAAVELADDQGRLLVKVCGREILHKTEAGGIEKVRLAGGGDGADEVLTALERVAARVEAAGVGAAVDGFLACGFVAHSPNQPGQELLLSLRQDPAFGPVVVVGVGGTLTEWYGRGTGGGSRLIFPAAGLTAGTVAAALSAHPLLSLLCRPSRLYPEPPFDAERVGEAAAGLAALGETCGPASELPATLEEIEINPAVASSGRLVALDGVGLVSRRKWSPVSRPLEKIGPLLAPRSAVVLGVSARGANPGRIILENLRRSEGIDPARLWVVHPKEKEIDGVPCVPRCADLPEKCDLAVVAIPAEGALAAIDDLVTTDRAESIILIPGGFAEAGEAGLANAIEARLEEGHAAAGGGPVLVGGNCLGIVSRDQYNTFFLPLYKLPFRPGKGENLAMISQSGAYLVTFASNYDGVICPRASISFGNQMDLTVADFLHHFVAADGVDTIACYVEGFQPGDGARFLRFTREARARGQRVIVFKAGKTELGARAAASHTASLAGDYDVARSCLEAAGATVAATLDEFEDLITTFTLLGRRSAGAGRVGILSNAGFECSTVMDSLAGLTLARFDAATRRVLDEALPGFAHRDNPVDATPMATTDAYLAASRAILACPEVDAAILSAVPVTPALDTLPAAADGRHREDLLAETSLARGWIREIQASTKPVVVVIDSGSMYDPFCDLVREAGIPVFRKIDRAARALAALCRSDG